MKTEHPGKRRNLFEWRKSRLRRLSRKINSLASTLEKDAPCRARAHQLANAIQGAMGRESLKAMGLTKTL